MLANLILSVLKDLLSCGCFEQKDLGLNKAEGNFSGYVSLQVYHIYPTI